MAASLAGLGRFPVRFYSRSNCVKTLSVQSFLFRRSSSKSSKDEASTSDGNLGNKPKQAHDQSIPTVPHELSNSELRTPVSASDAQARLSGLDLPKSASPTEEALDKFSKVVDKVKKAHLANSDMEKSQNDEPEDLNESFASMLRKSKFVSLGEHKDKLVQGEIIEVMEDDLYIDFGGKFHCVCPRPKRNGDRYQRGTKVLLSLQCMEMSSAFLGSDVHVTLLEADATLLGLAARQKSRPQTQRNQAEAGKQ